MVTIDTGVQGKPGIAVEENIHDARESDANPVIAPFRRSVFLRWLVHDSPYITMLLLALAGVIFRLPVTYWVILMPAFGFISVATGWRHFVTRNDDDDSCGSDGVSTPAPGRRDERVTISITARVHEARVSISRGGNQTSCAMA